MNIQLRITDLLLGCQMWAVWQYVFNYVYMAMCLSDWCVNQHPSRCVLCCGTLLVVRGSMGALEVNVPSLVVLVCVSVCIEIHVRMLYNSPAALIKWHLYELFKWTFWGVNLSHYDTLFDVRVIMLTWTVRGMMPPPGVALDCLRQDASPRCCNYCCYACVTRVLLDVWGYDALSQRCWWWS